MVANTTGLNDNGSGVAAMLEVARVLGAADCLAGEQKHTVIFVAIDKEVSKLSGVHIKVHLRKVVTSSSFACSINEACKVTRGSREERECRCMVQKSSSPVFFF